uniref:Bms1-type G domain-containing protein n=1 Tax=Ciona savignyi TaxID=51511 RepID=H2YNI0_CIOSA
MEGEAPAKSHRVRHSGRKAEKRQQKDNEAETKQRNPKAFAIQSANKLNRAFRRAQDVKSRKHHIPVVDRTPLEPPPVVVAIVGPPKVGKTTLLNGILKHYTRQKISNIQGPVTLVTGKHRRLTLIECNNDLTSMIDVAKIADLILLMVDASFGFEMETFEFLNICQVHGFPKVMGILTHLDSFKQPKTLKKTKKNLKHRFWTELYQGAKLFYLTGMVYGEYPRTEIRNLCRFISVMKFRPLTWRSSHSYVLADRMEDITDPEKLRVEPHCNRNISVYGYVRGTHLKPSTMVHIPGLSTLSIDPSNYPCLSPHYPHPTPQVLGITPISPPFHPQLPPFHPPQEPRQNLPESIMMSSMIDTTTTMDSKMTESKVALFTGEEPFCLFVTSCVNSSVWNVNVSMHRTLNQLAVIPLTTRSVPDHLSVGDNVVCECCLPCASIPRFVMGFKLPPPTDSPPLTPPGFNISSPRMMEVRMPDEELVEDAGRRRRRAIFQGGGGAGEGGYVVENHQYHENSLKTKSPFWLNNIFSSLLQTFVDDSDDESSQDEYEHEGIEQTRMNREEFENMDDATRVLYEGFRPGLYIRVELHNVPTELVEHFDPTYPLILGGVTSTEGNMGYLRTRVKRHRWYKKILKTRDPVIVSVGWRRYQTLPMYYMEDHNLRQRMLKYTPQYMHCWGLMYGPITPQGAGFLAVQSISGSTPQFRIAATGTILESDCSTNLVKKLKLVGYPYKIYKNTCFVKGMFNSPLEVAKFEGASIKSVSGIRGHIKKAVTGGGKEQGPPGSFRGMFEDKLLMSDIVFCRTWYPVQVPKMYVVASNLLIQKKDSWTAMKSVGQLRFEQNVKVPVKGDSLYKVICISRLGRQFHGLVVPRALQRELPFKSKPKNERGKKEGKRDKLMKKAVVREPKDKQIAALMVALRTMDNSKKRTKKEERKKQMAHHKMMLEKQEIKDHWRHKEAKKKIYKALAKSEKRKSKSSTE